jgi:hypothetical protein
MTLQQLASNANNVSRQAQHAAGAAYLLGMTNAHALCPFCIEAADPQNNAEVHGIACGGECDRCPYVNVDVCLVRLP